MLEIPESLTIAKQLNAFLATEQRIPGLGDGIQRKICLAGPESIL